MTVLGEILLAHFNPPSFPAHEAIIAAVEELEKHADAQPDLVFRVELAMMQAGEVGVPYNRIDDWYALLKDKGER